MIRQGEEVDHVELIGVRALREWITGQRGEHPMVLLVDDGAPVDVLEHATERDQVVLLPLTSGAYRGRAEVVRYSGALSDVGDELFLGERGVELEDYVAASFIQVVGPTAVRFSDASSWSAFLIDAEIARDTGVFPTALIDPRVLLAGRSALANPLGLAVPNALRLRADGGVSVGVQGEVIGHVAELERLLATPLPGVAALGEVLPQPDLIADLALRPWIARYLLATDLMKMLRLGNGAARISGFGWRVVEDGLDDAVPLPTDPILLETADGLLLADTATLRRQLLSPTTAVVVDAVQNSKTLSQAAMRVAERLHTRAADAETLCHEALRALGIHFGERPGIPSTGADA